MSRLQAIASLLEARGSHKVHAVLTPEDMFWDDLEHTAPPTLSMCLVELADSTYVRKMNGKTDRVRNVLQVTGLKNDFEILYLDKDNQNAVSDSFNDFLTRMHTHMDHLYHGAQENKLTLLSLRAGPWNALLFSTKSENSLYQKVLSAYHKIQADIRKHGSVGDNEWQPGLAD